MSKLQDLLEQTNEDVMKGWAFRTNDNGESFELLKLGAIETEDGTEDSLVATVYAMDDFLEFVAQEVSDAKG